MFGDPEVTDQCSDPRLRTATAALYIYIKLTNYFWHKTSTPAARDCFSKLTEQFQVESRMTFFQFSYLVRREMQTVEIVVIFIFLLDIEIGVVKKKTESSTIDYIKEYENKYNSNSNTLIIEIIFLCYMNFSG